MDESKESLTPRYFTTGADGTLYVSHKNDNNGKYIAFSPSLQELWSVDHNKLPHSNVAISQEGVMAVSTKTQVRTYYSDNQPLLAPPQNMQFDIVNNYNVELAWEAPANNDLIGYNIYRNVGVHSPHQET